MTYAMETLRVRICMRRLDLGISEGTESFFTRVSGEGFLIFDFSALGLFFAIEYLEKLF